MMLQSLWSPVAVLPWVGLLPLAVHVAWAVVLAALVAQVLAWCMAAGERRRWWQRSCAGLVAGWTLLPIAASPAQVLGLAFQIPSGVTLLACAVLLYRGVCGTVAVPMSVATAQRVRWMMGGGVVFGWLLLLDTFALLPVHLYAWGFSPVLAAVLLACGLWLGLPASGRPAAVWGLLWPLAVLLFVLTRLPTGNVWDAVLDPWLWLVLHVLLWRDWRARRQSL